MTYAYKVRDTLGNVHEGQLEADDVEQASGQLRRDGLTVLEIEEEDDVGELTLFARRVRKSDVIYATNQLAIMVETGVTLSAALTAIIDQEENPTFRNVLADLRSSVEGGEDFSVALARHPKQFDRTYVSLVRASEATGMLAEMLDRIAQYLRKELETRSKVRSAMMYPGVMSLLATGVTIFLLTYVLPKFTPLFSSRGMDLPTPTKVLIFVSGLMTNWWFVWLGLFVLAAAAIFIGRRTEQGRQVWDWVIINLPIVGPTMRKVIISRSIRTLGVLVKGGASMLDAIKLAGDVCGNIHYERIWRHVLVEITAGNQIHSALAGNPLFPSTLVQMIAAGEETGKLEMVLSRVSDYYDQEVEISLKTATSLIEPILIVIMGAVVGGIGLALMLPIFSLSRPG